ncbi:hypothetical protein A9Q84_19425 [Halobacteriovorax marinus]|uniref:PilZ domain-containing protein n=1 Tax=Halobacteriovorax marinus TaxID=97084 RepID=A0A1Y5F2I8_9BACT|nr:hypothetical protein A9Q84_19425 [Halobacteriovorax marinus]
MGKRRALESLNEITEVLQSISEHGNHLELCQTIGDSTHRSLSLIKNINDYSNDLAIRPKNKLNQFNFDPDIPIFAKNEFDSVVFQCEIKKLNHKNLIVANIPDLMYLLNTRSCNRYNFENLSLPVIFKNDSVINYQRKHLFFEGILIDISENGLSYTTYNDIAFEYKWGDLIQFSTINGYSLSQKITGRIVYLKNTHESNGQIKTKIAVKFDRLIPIKQILKYIDNQIYINA